MTLALLLIAWIALPVGLWLILKSKTSYALPVTAIVISITLLAVSQWMQTENTVVSTSSGQNGVFQSATYAISKGHNLQTLSLNYLLVAVLGVLIARFGKGLTLHMKPLGFGMNHLGCTAIALQPVIAAAYMPRRYADYPTWFAWTNRLYFASSVLSFLGLALLVLLTLTALTQTQRKT